jgi:hypothetical protein
VTTDYVYSHSIFQHGSIKDESTLGQHRANGARLLELRSDELCIPVEPRPIEPNPAAELYPVEPGVPSKLYPVEQDALLEFCSAEPSIRPKLCSLQ